MFFCVDFLDSCRASTLLAELDDDEDLPEPDEEDDENEDDNQEDQEYEEVMVQCICFSSIFSPFILVLNLREIYNCNKI